jgi:ATP-dependent Clp protease adapter protein ClpS
VPTEQIDIKETTGTIFGAPSSVILYNDESHNMEEVAVQIIKATQCTADQAMAIMMEAHTKGRAVAYHGHRERCEHVAAVLEQIKLKVDIE